MSIRYDPPLRIFVTVGTDHHPFDRLMDWVDRWVHAYRATPVECMVQRGMSTPPRWVESREYLDHGDLVEAIKTARVVVSHAGPGTVIECLRLGSRPVVVPRLKSLGEHVDDHQLTFARRMAETGRVLLAEDEDAVARLLNRAVAEPELFRAQPQADRTNEAVRRFTELVDRLVEVPPSTPLGRRQKRSLGSVALSGERKAIPRLRSEKKARTRQVRVLYIGGSGRSGSTLLARMIGQVPGACAPGELVHLWSRGLLENQLCGCGAAFRECVFWSEVGERAFGGWESLDLDEILKLQHTVDRHRYIPLMVSPGLWPNYSRRLQFYTRVISDLYRGILEASGAELIVDSSKNVSYAFLLRQVGGVDLRVVQLVRESRGVAFSWTKRVLRPEIVGREAYMPTLHPMRSATEWLVDNLLFHVLASIGVPHLLVRYESLVQGTVDTIERVASFAGFRETPDLAFVQADEVELKAGHDISGNPIRFQRGRVPLRLNDEWRSRMPIGQRRLVAAITWPLLARYGYLRRQS